MLASPAGAVEQLDWCAPVVVRPDTRFFTFTPPCEPWWPDDEIARRADLVLDGFLQPSNSTIAPGYGGTCWGPQTMQSSSAYHDRLRAAAASYGRSLVFVYEGRFDLVTRAEAGTPGFDPAFLVDAQRDWRQVTDFFTRDRTPSCACGCEWSDDIGAIGQAPGTRMRDLVDALGGIGTYEHKVVYGTRPSSGGSAAGAPRRFFGVAEIGDQRNPAYRAWRIGHMRDAIDVGGFDVVELNNKFSQYFQQTPSWRGAGVFGDVASYLAADDTPWSSPIQGYGYPEYVQGWAAFADDLDAAGIPFSVTLQPFVWSANTNYDDPSTPTVNEAEVIKGVARRAKYVLLTRAPQFDQAALDAMAADIESAGIAKVTIVDGTCGNGSPPGRPPTQLAASLAIAPDAAVTGHFDATTLRVDVFGVATGPWDADLWCHCPSPPCGAPDASVAGQIGTSWQVPIDACDAAYATPIGARVPRVEVRRSSFTTATTRNVTLCTPTCSNGRDDDRDGFADYPADLGCDSAADTDETAPTLVCDDNADNDHDGRIDYPADPGCAAPSSNTEGGGRKALCGLGAELVLLAALGRSIRRRSA
jgi:hypothetical protein